MLIIIEDLNNTILNTEISNIHEMQNILKKIRLQLNLYLDKINNELNYLDKNSNIQFIFNMLESLKNNFELLDTLNIQLKSLIKMLENLKDNKLKEKIDEYNKQYIKTNSTFINIISGTTIFIDKLSTYIFIDFNKQEQSENNNTSSTSNKEKPKKNIENIKEKVLIISDKTKTITLPFTKLELEEKMKNDTNCKNYTDVILKYYTVPLSSFKNPAISRFREAFNLIINKEKSSTKEAFDLGLELFFNYNLNPAIITACRNLDELDIYLSCLEDNELDKFKCFDIVYEYMPTVVKKIKQ